MEKNNEMKEEPKLCYVKPPWAYFTTAPLEEQWGDDWDDAPYEHNAGEPYEFDENYNTDKEPWKIIKIAYDADLVPPCDNFFNSPYSVEKINEGFVPWLKDMFEDSGREFAIWAGTTIEDFARKIKKSGGGVYLPSSSPLEKYQQLAIVQFQNSSPDLYRVKSSLPIDIYRAVEHFETIGFDADMDNIMLIDDATDLVLMDEPVKKEKE